MIIAIIIGSIFLGIAIAPILLVVVRVQNSKKLKRMRNIKKILSSQDTKTNGRELQEEAEELELSVSKSMDRLSIKEATRLLANIKELVK